MQRIKENRRLTVIAQSGTNYKPTPTIVLKGQWLQELGFESGEKINVHCERGRIVITLLEKVIVEPGSD